MFSELYKITHHCNLIHIKNDNNLIQRLIIMPNITIIPTSLPLMTNLGRFDNDINRCGDIILKKNNHKKKLYKPTKNSQNMAEDLIDRFDQYIEATQACGKEQIITTLTAYLSQEGILKYGSTQLMTLLMQQTQYEQLHNDMSFNYTFKEPSRPKQTIINITDQAINFYINQAIEVIEGNPEEPDSRFKYTIQSHLVMPLNTPNPCCIPYNITLANKRDDHLRLLLQRQLMLLHDSLSMLAELPESPPTSLTLLEVVHMIIQQQSKLGLPTLTDQVNSLVKQFQELAEPVIKNNLANIAILYEHADKSLLTDSSTGSTLQHTPAIYRFETYKRLLLQDKDYSNSLPHNPMLIQDMTRQGKLYNIILQAYIRTYPNLWSQRRLLPHNNLKERLDSHHYIYFLYQYLINVQNSSNQDWPIISFMHHVYKQGHLGKIMDILDNPQLYKLKPEHYQNSPNPIQADFYKLTRCDYQQICIAYLQAQIVQHNTNYTQFDSNRSHNSQNNISVSSATTHDTPSTNPSTTSNQSTMSISRFNLHSTLNDIGDNECPTSEIRPQRSQSFS